MKSITLYIAILFSLNSFSQKTIDEVLKKFNKNDIIYIKPSELSSIKNYILLDAREKNEFDVSHLESAKYIGFNNYNENDFLKLNLDKKSTIVVYCSLGVRSEKIAEKIKKLGYTNIFNLYGGLFQWKNEGGKVFDNSNLETQNVHAFSKEWSVYLKKGKKVY